MTVTIWTTGNYEGAAPHPAITDTHLSKEMWGHAEHWLEELANGRLSKVEITNDHRSIDESRRAIDKASDAAERSEAPLREAGG